MNYTDRGKEIFRQEIQALNDVSERLGEEFHHAVEMIGSCKGKVVVSGVGKTGIIGKKISASLASTGTTSVFIHASEAMHGDLGVFKPEDIALLISNSGSSIEITQLIAPIQRIGCKMIAMTGNTGSRLAKEADLVLNTRVNSEACPLGLAPTSSTTAALVMGDALTICLMEQSHFKAENYALYHPGGALGRQLLNRVEHEMTTDIPVVWESALFRDVIYEVSNKRLGMTMVVNSDNKPVGIITDGDIRRAVQKFEDLKSLRAMDFMTGSFKHISRKALLTEALEMMDENNITNLAVTESETDAGLAGIISIHHIIDFRH